MLRSVRAVGDDARPLARTEEKQGFFAHEHAHQQQGILQMATAHDAHKEASVGGNPDDGEQQQPVLEPTVQYPLSVWPRT